MADIGLYDSASEISSNLGDASPDTDSLLEADAAEPGPAERPGLGQSSAAAQAAKAIQLANESIPDVTPDDGVPVAHCPAPRLPRWADEHTPLLDAGPAPPDYAAAAAWRRSLPSANNGNRAADVAGEPVLQSQITEGIVNDANVPNYSLEPVNNIAAFRTKPTSRVRELYRCCHLLTLAWIPMMAFLILFIIFFQPHLYWAQKRLQRMAELDHPKTSECVFNRYSEYAKFSFRDLGDFSFEEKDDEDELPLLTRTGNLNVFPGSATQDAAVEVWINVATTAPWEVAQLRIKEGWDSMTMVSPLLQWSDHHGTETSKQCIHTWVGIFMQPNVEIGFLKISAGNMDVAFGYSDSVRRSDSEGEADKDPSVNLTIRDRTSITIGRGKIDCRYLESREINLQTRSGDITGTYALHDAILIDSHNGDVDIAVEPKASDRSSQVLSNFTLRSKLDLISAGFPVVNPKDILEPDSGISVEYGYLVGSDKFRFIDILSQDHAEKRSMMMALDHVGDTVAGVLD